jgi:hypothetical protein
VDVVVVMVVAAVAVAKEVTEGMAAAFILKV